MSGGARRPVSSAVVRCVAGGQARAAKRSPPGGPMSRYVRFASDVCSNLGAQLDRVNVVVTFSLGANSTQ